MKLTAREDVEVPAAAAFQALADFDYWERAGLRRGMQIARQDELAQPAPGMTWEVVFDWRGERLVHLRLTEHVPPRRLAFAAEGESFKARLEFDVLEMGPRRCRITATAEALPQSLSARLMLQAVRLARGKAEDRFARRIGQLAADVQRRALKRGGR